MRWVFLILSLLATGAWVLFYFYIVALACAMSSTGGRNGSCSPPAPWQLGGEDLLYLVILPGLITGALWLVT